MNSLIEASIRLGAGSPVFVYGDHEPMLRDVVVHELVGLVEEMQEGASDAPAITRAYAALIDQMDNDPDADFYVQETATVRLSVQFKRVSIH